MSKVELLPTLDCEAGWLHPWTTQSINCVVTMLPTAVNSDYTVRHCPVNTGVVTVPSR